MKHTQGPWKVENPISLPGRILIKDGKGRYSCYVISGEFAQNVALPEQEAKSNARLIAAAPEMYELLKFYQGILDYNEKLSSLISKIEGGE